MQERTVTIHNKAGIHCRPSSVILNTVSNDYPGHAFVLISANGDQCDLTSIMGLLALGLACGDHAKLQVTGPREAEAADKIASLLEYEFDFPMNHK